MHYSMWDQLLEPAAPAGEIDPLSLYQVLLQKFEVARKPTLVYALENSCDGEESCS